MFSDKNLERKEGREKKEERKKRNNGSITVFVDLAIINLETCVVHSEHPIQEKDSTTTKVVQSHL